MRRFELLTSSLPRKRSTPELHRQKNLSERPGSNRRPSAWKADALPTELLSLKLCGENRIRTCEVKNSRFTVCPRWPLEYLPDILKNLIRADRGTRTHDLLITNQLL
jgi:hypothetical protein